MKKLSCAEYTIASYLLLLQKTTYMRVENQQNYRGPTERPRALAFPRACSLRSACSAASDNSF